MHDYVGDYYTTTTLVKTIFESKWLVFFLQNALDIITKV